MNSNTYVTNLLSDISSSCKASIKSQFPRLLNQLKKYKKIANIYKTIFGDKVITVESKKVNKLFVSLPTIDDISNIEFSSLIKILDDYGEYINDIEIQTVPTTTLKYLNSINLTNKENIKIICEGAKMNMAASTIPTKIESTETLFTNIETFCSNFISCIERVIKEIADTNPVYMELTENSLDYHIINKNSSPVMPISAALLNTEDSKYLYATRHINCGTSKIKPIHVPSTLKTLASFSAVHNSLITFSEVEMLNFVNYLFDAVRVLKDLGITFDMKGLVYSKESEFTRITDKIFNDNTIMQYISDFLLENDKKQKVGRINELISSFIEMNVVPININSLMQSVPLINTLNYSSGFNDLIASHPSMTAIQKDLIINTYIQADFNNSKYQYACAEWLVKDINKPKFVFDEIYIKCLLQSKDPSILANTKDPSKEQVEKIKKAGDAIYILLHASHEVTGDEIGKYVDGFSTAVAAGINDPPRQRYMQNPVKTSAMAGVAAVASITGLATAFVLAPAAGAQIDYERNGLLPVATAMTVIKCQNISTLCALLHHLENNSFLSADGLIAVSGPNQALSNAVLYISKYIDKEIKYTIIPRTASYISVVRVGARLQIAAKGDITKVANERYNTVIIRSLLYLSEIQRFINTELNAKLSIGKTSIINSLSLLGNNLVVEKQLNNSAILNN
jgi:hypothetical protein